MITVWYLTSCRPLYELCLCHSSHFACSLNLLSRSCIISTTLQCTLYNRVQIALVPYSWDLYHAQATPRLKIMQTWKNTEYRYRYHDILKYRYRIPNRLLKMLKKYRKTDTDFKYRHRPKTMCYTTVYDAVGEITSRSLKISGNGAIRWAIFHFPLAVCGNHSFFHSFIFV